MQGLVNIVNAVTGSIRFIFGMFFLCIMGLGLMFTAGTSYVAPQAADKFAESAERAHDKAIEAARLEQRNRINAAEGWGNADTASGDGEFAPDPEAGSAGWVD